MQANEDQSFRNDERRLSDVSSSFPIVQSANMPGQRSARAHDWCWEGDLSERREVTRQRFQLWLCLIQCLANLRKQTKTKATEFIAFARPASAATWNSSEATHVVPVLSFFFSSSFLFLETHFQANVWGFFFFRHFNCLMDYWLPYHPTNNEARPKFLILFLMSSEYICLTSGSLFQ